MLRMYFFPLLHSNINNFPTISCNAISKMQSAPKYLIFCICKDFCANATFKRSNTTKEQPNRYWNWNNFIWIHLKTPFQNWGCQITSFHLYSYNKYYRFVFFVLFLLNLLSAEWNGNDSWQILHVMPSVCPSKVRWIGWIFTCVALFFFLIQRNIAIYVQYGAK